MSKPRKRVGKRNKASRCETKQSFDTLENANQAANRGWGRKAQAWGFMTGYKCSVCKKYHYGHLTV